MINIGLLWAVLALIAVMAGYYVQIINRLLDLPRRRKTSKLYRIRMWLSWTVLALFVAVFALIIKIWLTPPVFYYIVITAFTASQIIHLVVFLGSYWRDLRGIAEAYERRQSTNGNEK